MVVFFFFSAFPTKFYPFVWNLNEYTFISNFSNIITIRNINLFPFTFLIYWNLGKTCRLDCAVKNKCAVSAMYVASGESCWLSSRLTPPASPSPALLVCTPPPPSGLCQSLSYFVTKKSSGADPELFRGFVSGIICFWSRSRQNREK